MSRVLLVDDHAIVRRGVRAILERAGHDVVGEASTGAAALEWIANNSIDVVLLDARLPDMGGLEVLRRLAEKGVAERVLIFSGDPSLVADALHLGARGYVVKSSDPNQIVTAIDTVARGETYLDADAMEALRHIKRTAPTRPLSPRENEVVTLIARGMSSKEIATELGISFRTVETHREHVLKKLGVGNVAGIVRYAISAGLLSE